MGLLEVSGPFFVECVYKCHVMCVPIILLGVCIKRVGKEYSGKDKLPWGQRMARS